MQASVPNTGKCGSNNGVCVQKRGNNQYIKVYDASLCDTDKFVCTLFKQNISKEKELIKDIEYLERNIEYQPHNLNLLSDKEADLEKLRESKIKGEQVRSRIQWLSEGEKPSKTFCTLETKNYIDKTIKN